MMYSFMSLDRTGDEDHLVAGEYGRKGGSHRLMRYPLDRDTELLRRDDRGWAVPAELYDRQVERMQGATLVDEHLGHHRQQRQGQARRPVGRQPGRATYATPGCCRPAPRT